MKLTTLFIFLTIIFSNSAWSSCLDNKHEVHAINAKITGMYVTKSAYSNDSTIEKKPIPTAIS